MKLSDLIFPQIEKRPHTVAFVFDDTPVTIAEFELRVQAAKIWLQGMRLQRGDVIAIWMVNRLEWFVLLFAAARLGIIIVAVNTRYRSEELSHILRSSGARLLFTQSSYKKIDFLNIVEQLTPSDIPELEHIVLIGEQTVKQPKLVWPVSVFNPQASSLSPLQDDSHPTDTVLLFPTSGTTKAPKLVMHPQITIADHARRCSAAYELNHQDASLLLMLPVCGVFGLNASLAALAASAPVIVQDTFDANEAGRLIKDYGITHTFGSDEMFNRLCEVYDEARPFPSLRLCGFGAFTSSFTDSANDCWARGVPLHGMYGSSEVLAIFSGQPQYLSQEQKIEGGGLPVAGSEAKIRIRDTHSGEILPQGQSGEIEIQAPSLFTGYFKNSEDTARAFRDGYFVTGDLGHLRPDGTLVYETRLGDAMRLGGHLVSPLEIEELLKKMEGVTDAHVVQTLIDGQPRAVAFLIVEPGLQVDLDQMIRQLKQSVAGYKVPARVWIVDQFPQTQGPNGLKSSRVKLREMAAEKISLERDQ